jgi:hypothetical protein
VRSASIVLPVDQPYKTAASAAMVAVPGKAQVSV